MAKMGRPTKDDPISHVVSVKFNEKDYNLMVEYANRHNMTISRLIRYSIEQQIIKDKQD